MESSQSGWQIICDRETFEKCRTDERFAYIVALARSANALNAAHSFMILCGNELTPKAVRDRLNSYFFASALVYEILKLIRRMNKVFHNDEVFEAELRIFLKDPSAKRIEEAYLKPLRRKAVFHFDPEAFAETIEKSTVNECVFMEAVGKLQGDIHYSFADIIAAEILVGFAEDSEKFYTVLEDAMSNTRDLVVRFVPAAETFIGHHLNRWGFKKLEEYTQQTKRI